MKAPRIAVIALAACAAAVSARAPQQPASSGQVFRASTDAVTVDVAVRSGGTAIEGLKAADFELLDNGVPQRIESLESTDATTLPVDVTLLVDTGDEVADEADGINKQVARIAAMLRPIDRLRVWALNPWIEELRPLTPIGAAPTLPAAAPGGLAAVNDAIAAALMAPVAPDARHLAIAITNGVDTESVLRLDALKAIAERSNATLHIAQVDVTEFIKLTTFEGGSGYVLWRTSAEKLREVACEQSRRCQPTHGFFEPHYTPAPGENRFDPLAAIADGTGGKLHTLGLFVEHNAADVFANAFKDYQQNYVLRYVPQRVPRTGWHTLSVRIPDHSGYTIHARRGYSMDDGATSGPAAAATDAAAPETPVVRTILQAYERGDYAAVEAIAQDPADLENAIRDLRALGNLWPQTPHREAVLALDLAAAAFANPHDEAAQDAGPWLGDEYRWLRSPLGPGAFEHDWLVAELALLEGLRDPEVARPLQAIVLKRFPGDAQFQLADAILAEQSWIAAGSPADGLTAVLQKYDDVAASSKTPALAFEARLRAAWVLHLASRDADALARLDTIADPGADADARYLRLLFRGRVLLALGRARDAADAGRALVLMRSNAKSAHELLEQAQLSAGDANAAKADTLAAPAFDDAADPWSGYEQGRYRDFPALLDRLRAGVR